MKYQTYPNYKPSGVEWLGDVPEHWDVSNISTISNKITNGYVGATRDLFHDTGVRYLQSLHIKKNKINFHTPYFVSEEWNNEKNKSILKSGDVLVVQTGDIGQVAVVTKEYEGCNCHALIIISTTDELNGFYLSWLLNSNYGFHSLKSIETGALHPHLNCDAVKNVKTPIPELFEQQKIAQFLDHETAKIDTLIDKQQRLIALLKEKRQAVISHAVTKGLNPNAPMKPSGVEWLGDVPVGWEVKRFKNLFKIEKRIAGKLGYEILSITQKGIKIKDTESGEGQLSMDYSKYQIVHKGDFAMNHMDLLTGFVDISKYEGVTSPDYRVFTLADKNSFPDYYLCFLQMGYLNKLFFPFGQGAANLGRWRLPTEAFNDFLTPYPPENEQKEIANFIKATLEKMSFLVEKANSAIELMQERRTALISAAVTGKIDVRDWGD